MKHNRACDNGRASLQWMTGTAMMIAITLVLGSTPLGLIRTPILTATTLHIPVIIATLVLGLKAGLFTGFVFGIQSLISNFASTSFFGPFFINPLVSVLPRVLFPVCVYVVACCINRFVKCRTAVYVAASALGTAAHTAMVMGMIYLLNGEKIGSMIVAQAGVPEAIASRGVGMGILTMAVANGVPEMIVAALIAPIVTLALDKAFGRMR